MIKEIGVTAAKLRIRATTNESRALFGMADHGFREGSN